MESGNVTGENSTKSKKEIEKTLASLNHAYKVMQDDMYQDTSIDIVSDARLIETLLAQEGITEKEKSS